ncbi:MAG: hypothetical protein PHP46_05750, partial [Candidatus Omnitrophica bacterium]|nr:hypothetical protein [Candidatus Omnitrophota bacterium]
MKTIKVVITVVLLLMLAGTALAESYEYYYWNSPTDYLLKRVYKDNGDIYEYLNEAPFPGEYYGRTSLLYTASTGTYSTYDWDLDQVTICDYIGIYDPIPDSPIRSAVIAGQRRFRYVYDHHNQMQNLDTTTNGWTMREKSVYWDDGITLKEEFVYNVSEVMTRHSLYDLTGNLTDEYLYDDT